MSSVCPSTGGSRWRIKSTRRSQLAAPHLTRRANSCLGDYDGASRKRRRLLTTAPAGPVRPAGAAFYATVYKGTGMHITSGSQAAHHNVPSRLLLSQHTSSSLTKMLSDDDDSEDEVDAPSVVRLLKNISSSTVCVSMRYVKQNEMPNTALLSMYVDRSQFRCFSL